MLPVCGKKSKSVAVMQRNWRQAKLLAKIQDFSSETLKATKFQYLGTISMFGGDEI